MIRTRVSRLSAAEARDYANRLGHDPFLVGLFTLVANEQMYAKHKAIQDLYEEERTERTSLWKDVSRLKLQIPESAQQYLSAHRKSSILAQDMGDAL